MSRFTHSLDPFFKPQSVAVVGASATPGSVGSIVMRNLLENQFGGVVYPVNPKRKSVHGVLSYASLLTVPEAVDLAVIATPAASVPAAIAACVERGIPAAIVISAGFSELGAEGRALEKQVRDLAHGKMRIVGPNCLGILHPHPPSAPPCKGGEIRVSPPVQGGEIGASPPLQGGARGGISGLNASFAACMPQPGRIAMLSQSGAICTAILDWARESSIGFSTFVSVGTMLDVDFADLIDYFGDDPHTQSIVLYMESVGDVRRFVSAARAVARSKHVIVVKAGRHEAGARAAASHTGALAGSDAVFDAALRQAGVLRVAAIPDLFNMSEILASQPAPRGPALAIVTNAGGPGVMATDALMTEGGQLASLSAETIAALSSCLPPFWSHSNPIDVLGDATPERYRQAVEIVAKDPSVDGLLILLTPQAMTDPTATARQIAPFTRLAKPVLASWMGGADVRQGRSVLREAGIAHFDSPEAAIRAFLHMVQYRRNQELLYERPAALPEDWGVVSSEGTGAAAIRSGPDHKRVRTLIDQARQAGRTLLTEVEAKHLLAAYGIPTVPTAVAKSADVAATIAQRLGFPIVLKLYSETITHKSDAGGVQLNLADESAVRQAFVTIQHNAQKYAQEHGFSPDSFQGVTVQPMVKHKGFELIVGSSVDVQFGPVILFGAGGILVEIFKDRALALPPLNRTLARRLMERTQIYKALHGVRGQKSVPLDQLETLLVRFSYLLGDFLEIQEIDINPLLASPDGLIALDARVLLAPPRTTTRLTIEPYPNQYTTAWQLKDGTPITIRAIRPEDEPLLVAHHAALSERSIRMRYFSMVKLLTRESLIRLCHLDYAREMALVAERKDDNGQPEFLGVARYYMNPETRAAEFAVIVRDQYQGQGLGQDLMERLIAVARERGVKKLVGLVLRENAGMLALANELGFSEPRDRDQESVAVELELQ